MANIIEFITNFTKDAIDTVFMEDSKTAILENGSKYIDLNFKEAGYVKVASLLLDGLSDYYRVNHTGVEDSTDYTHYNDANSRDGYQKGNVSIKWEIFQLAYDRGIAIPFDDMDNEETAKLLIGNIVTEFIRTKVVPEVDACRFGRLLEKCNSILGNLKVGETIAPNTIISQFNAGFKWLTEMEVPADEQVIFVNPSVMEQIKETTELTHYITQSDYKSESGITFKVMKYDGRPIIEVPSDRFFDNVVVGKNGFRPGTNSHIVNYIICNIKCCVPVRKLQKAKLWTPDMIRQFDGYEFTMRLYHDTLIPKNKVPGIYASVSSVVGSTASSALKLSMVEGNVQNAYKINAHYTAPAGILGTLVASANVITLGSAVTIDGSTVFTVAEGVDVVDATNSTLYFALVQGGIAVAVSPQITLTKKA